MRFILPTALAIAVLPGSAGAADTVAEVLTGEALLAQCDSAAPPALDRCTDYIAGVVDTLMLGYRYGDNIAGFRGCVPATVPDRDVADLVLQVLRAAGASIASRRRHHRACDDRCLPLSAAPQAAVGGRRTTKPNARGAYG